MFVGKSGLRTKSEYVGCHETPHRVHRAHRAASRRGRRVTGRFASSSVRPLTCSTFPAYSVKTQTPSSGYFKLYFSAVYAVRAVRCFVTPYIL